MAVRTVKTGGLYAVVRHPLYAATMLGRVGFVVQNPCALNVVIFLLSSGCYVWRALLEEAFLSQSPDYRAYMERVPHRLILCVF